MVEILKSSVLALYFAEWGCALVHDKETDEWTMEFDDEEQEVILLESPEQPFVEVEVPLLGTLTTARYLDMRLWLETERQLTENKELAGAPA